MSMKDYADRISQTILDQEAAIGAECSPSSKH